MALFHSQKSAIFDNNSLHFSKQDTVIHVLLALFIFLLPPSARLPHARLWLCAAILFFLFLILRFSHVAFPKMGKKAIFLLPFYGAVLSGIFKPQAAFPTLIAFILSLALLLPKLSMLPRVYAARAMAFSGGFCGAYALWQQLNGYALSLWSDTERFGALSRATSFFDNPNLLGAFLAPALLFAMEEVRLSLPKGGFSIYALCAFFCGAGLMLSYSRGAWLGACAGACVWLWRISVRKGTHLCAFSPVLSRALSFLSPDSSVSYRFSLWKSIFGMPPLPLLFGAGEGRGALMALLSPHLAAGLEHIEHTHSLYLHMLCAHGLIGLIPFLFYLFTALRGREGERGAVFDGAFISLLIYGIFDDPLYSGQIGVLFWFLSNAN